METLEFEMFDFLRKKFPANKEMQMKEESRGSSPSIIEQLLAAQLMLKYKHPRDAFSILMTNKLARGYLFGIHDSYFQSLGKLDRSDPAHGFSLMRSSYKSIFGDQAGFALFEMSVAAQEDSDFVIGRLSGGEEYLEFIQQGTQPLGLTRILFLGFDAAAVWRTLDNNRAK